MNNIIVVSDQVWLSPTTQEEELASSDPIPSTAEKLLFAKEMKKSFKKGPFSHVYKKQIHCCNEKKNKIPQVYK